jgi:2-oxoglutarate ferredoxin oxidoreductase subunit delta
MVSNGYGDKGRGTGTGMGRGRWAGGGRGRGTGGGRGNGQCLGKGVGGMSPAGFSPPASEPRDTNQQAQVLMAQAQAKMDQLSAINQRIADIEASGTIPSAPGKKRFRNLAALIDQERCMSCGLCIEACPEQAISMNDIVEIDSGKCTGCGSCIKVCPNEAISLLETTARRASS